MTPRDKGLVSDELGGLLTYRIIIITSRKRTEVCRVTGDLVLSAYFHCLSGECTHVLSVPIKRVTAKRHFGMEVAEEGGVPAPSGVMVPSLTANG